MTSDVANSQGFSIIYGEVQNYNNEWLQKWLGSWGYSNAIHNSWGDTSAHMNCQRDKTYTMPLCCEITVSK